MRRGEARKVLEWEQERACDYVQRGVFGKRLTRAAQGPAQGVSLVVRRIFLKRSGL